MGILKSLLRTLFCRHNFYIANTSEVNGEGVCIVECKKCGRLIRCSVDKALRLVTSSHLRNS